MDSVLQHSLFDVISMAPTVQPAVAREATIQERFVAFDKANPHIYQALLTLTLQMRSRGVKAYGVKGLFEICRWQLALQTGGQEEFRLSNDFSSRYARLLIERNPELKGFFELRSLRAE